MYSVELVKLTGANFESNIYKPGSVAKFKCIEILNVAKNRYAFRIWFSAMKKTKMLKTIRYFEMTVICGNSGQECRLFTWLYRRPGGKDSWVALSSCTNCKLAAMIWLFSDRISICCSTSVLLSSYRGVLKFMAVKNNQCLAFW